MPRGGRRNGSGRRRKPVAEHVRLGSYRKDRHGPLPADLQRGATVLPMPAPVAAWEPTEGDLGTLQLPGRGFLARMMASYSFTLVEGSVLVEAAHCVDRLAALRATGTLAVRDEVALVRLLAALVGQLRIEE